MFGREKKIKAIFFKEIGEKEYEKIGEKSFNETEDNVQFEGKTFPFTEKCILFLQLKRRHIETVVYYDYAKESVLKIDNTNIGVDAEFLDKMLTTGKRGIIGQLLNALRTDMEVKNNWQQLAKPIIIFAIGALIGYLIGSPNPLGR